MSLKWPHITTTEEWTGLSFTNTTKQITRSVWQTAKARQPDMERVSDMLHISSCLQLVDKQDTSGGTHQHFPRDVSEEEEHEEDDAKNMTVQGCKQPDKTP